MPNIYISLLLAASIILLSCQNKQVNKPQSMMINRSDINAPTVKKVATELITHGDKRIDNYYWMKLSDDQKNATQKDSQTLDVIEYLDSENAYTEKMTAHLKPFQEKLYEEIVGRIKQTDISVPYYKNGYYYITRYEEAKEYAIYTRKKGDLANEEQMLLDVNKLAEPYEFYSAVGLTVSPDNKILAYGEDTLSRRIYSVKFLNLETGDYYDDVILNTTGSVTWANDNKTVFYTRKDDALRAYKIFRHTLGTPSENDVEIYHEKDETFSCYVYKSKSEKYIMIGSFATLSNEYRYLDANNPNGDFILFDKRERKLEYSINHYQDHWYILTNKDNAYNFKLMQCSLRQTQNSDWQEFIPHDESSLISNIEIFKDYLVINQRIGGISKIRVMPWDDVNNSHFIDFNEETYFATSSTNPEFDTEVLRIFFSSLTTPATTYDYNMQNRNMEMRKRQEVVGDFDPSNYVSERIMADARDGEKVPVSLVYRKDLKKDGNAPLLLYAYGSYGSSTDPYFSSVRLSLLDRGFIFAIAHIRGGQEMGRMWYENGKLLKKINTFTDFIDAGEFLVSEKYTASDKLFCMGGSAGGLLIGAVINMAPELWKGAVAAVPFVDVVTTMLDESIPLTTGEFDEWGNPKNEAYYHYMKSYSPYDNVESKEYPALLVTTGFFDSQVQYWEPAKWVAKLRDMKKDNNPLLLHTDMSAGHGGKSGRFQRYRETALEYSFLLDLAGKVKTEE